MNFFFQETELTFDYRMEFVDNKKTACFCGAAKCSGLIGEKPKEAEKKAALLPLKKKLKRKGSATKTDTNKTAAPAASVPAPLPIVKTTTSSAASSKRTSVSSTKSSVSTISASVISRKRRRLLDESKDPLVPMLDRFFSLDSNEESVESDGKKKAKLEVAASESHQLLIQIFMTAPEAPESSSKPEDQVVDENEKTVETIESNEEKDEPMSNVQETEIVAEEVSAMEMKSIPEVPATQEEEEKVDDGLRESSEQGPAIPSQEPSSSSSATV